MCEAKFVLLSLILVVVVSANYGFVTAQETDVCFGCEPTQPITVDNLEQIQPNQVFEGQTYHIAYDMALQSGDIYPIDNIPSDTIQVFITQAFKCKYTPSSFC